jgi:hypothetical protein
MQFIDFFLFDPQSMISSVSLKTILKECIAHLICINEYNEAIGLCQRLLQINPSDIVTHILHTEVVKQMNKKNDDALQLAYQTLNMIDNFQEKSSFQKNVIQSVSMSDLRETRSQTRNERTKYFFDNTRRMKVHFIYYFASLFHLISFDFIRFHETNTIQYISLLLSLIFCFLFFRWLIR